MVPSGVEEHSFQESLRTIAKFGRVLDVKRILPSLYLEGDPARGRTYLPLPMVARFAMKRRGGFGRAAPSSL